jgi:hypothetical protein
VPGQGFEAAMREGGVMAHQLLDEGYGSGHRVIVDEYVVDAGRRVGSKATIDQAERKHDAAEKREYVKGRQHDAWDPLTDRSTIFRRGNTIVIDTEAAKPREERELTEHQLRIHDKAAHSRSSQYVKPDVVEELRHGPDCLWRRDAVDPDAYGAPRDVCTCGPWWVRVPSVPAQAVHGTADQRSRAHDVSTAGEQRRQTEHRRRQIGELHGATPGQRPIYNDAAYMDAWNAARGMSSDTLFADLFGKRRQCDHCCKWYGYERSTARYCSVDCRVNASRGAYRKPEPVFRCDEIFEIPSAPIAIPARVPRHDQLCLARRDAINDHVCSCNLTQEESVTLRLRIGAKNYRISPKCEDGQAMAA